MAGRKEGAKHITREVMEKVLGLKDNGCGEGLIADTLEISTASVRRVIEITQAVERGEDVTAMYGGNNARMKEIAREIVRKRSGEAAAPSEENTEQVRDYASEAFGILQEMTALLVKQNELLEKFCSSFGVK